jgi:hypothetical protein
MKLFKEGNGVWAGRTALDEQDDLDVIVQEFLCGKSITTIHIARNSCREGMILSFHYDGERVCQFDASNVFMGSDRIENGEAKLFSWTYKPYKLLFQNNTSFVLEYES